MTKPTRSLGEALRGLPVPDPPGDGWERLARSLGRAPARRWPGFAVAAVLLVGLALGLRLGPGLAPPGDSGSPTAGLVAGPTTPTVAALREESVQWEQLLEAQPDNVTSVAAASAQLALAERIALIDLLLAAADGDAARRALWGERVLLLRDLYQLRSDPGLVLAEAGRSPSLLTVSL